MPTHGLLMRDERDFYLQKLPAAEMRPVEVEAAEQLGYHSVWFSDHVCMGRDEGVFHTVNMSGTRAYPNQPTMSRHDPTMGAIAGATTTIRMASSVWIAPYRHPLVAAHQLATVDVLSNGRLIVGVGSGWDPQEFAAVGGDFEHRGSVTEEQIEIFKHAWSAPYVDFHGRFYEITAVSLEPKPVQKPTRRSSSGRSARSGRAGRRAVRRYLSDVPRQLRGTRPASSTARRGAARGRAHRGDAPRLPHVRLCSGLVVEPGDEAARRSPRMTLTGSADQVLADIDRFAAAGYST